MRTTGSKTREELQRSRERVRSLREERQRLSAILDQAKAAVDEHESDATVNAALAAKHSVDEVSSQLEAAQDEQTRLLQRLGDAEAGYAGGAFAGVNGWGDVARTLDLERGELRADVPLGGLMQQPMMAGVSVGGDPSSVSTVRAPFVQQPLDRRFIYPVFPRQTLDLGALAVVDYRQDAVSGSGSVTGDVMRDPTSVAPKAELDVGITAGSEDVEQFAITIDNVPEVLFSAEPALQSFLRSRMQHVLDSAIDTHVISQILDATPPSGSSGSGRIEQVRNAVADTRAHGATPSVLVLNPDDAAALDLTTTGADDAYVFATRSTGSASPLWSLAIVEVPSLTDPILIDPALLGVLYAGTATILIDPYTGLKTNTVRLRLELEALLHVRSPAGAYVVA